VLWRAPRSATCGIDGRDGPACVRRHDQQRRHCIGVLWGMVPRSIFTNQCNIATTNTLTFYSILLLVDCNLTRQHSHPPLRGASLSFPLQIERNNFFLHRSLAVLQLYASKSWHLTQSGYHSLLNLLGRATPLQPPILNPCSWNSERFPTVLPTSASLSVRFLSCGKDLNGYMKVPIFCIVRLFSPCLWS
jgi:hypothetical protein